MGKLGDCHRKMLLSPGKNKSWFKTHNATGLGDGPDTSLSFVILVSVIGIDHHQHLIVWFPYNHWQSFTIAGITSKLFSDCNDHTETKFSFCQRSPTIPATAHDRNDHDCWDGIRAYLCDNSDRNKLMETTSAAIAVIVMIVTIPAIIWKS